MNYKDDLMIKKDSFFFMTEKECKEYLASSKEKKIAIVYLTTEGVQYADGGVARQVLNHFQLFRQLKKFLKSYQIKLDLYAAEPLVCKAITRKKKHTDGQSVLDVLNETNGKFLPLLNNTYGNEWMGNPSNWKILCASAATQVVTVAKNYDAVLAIAGSSCFGEIVPYIHKQAWAAGEDIRTIHVTNDSAFSDFWVHKNQDVFAADSAVAQWTKLTPNAKIGFVSQYMKKLFKEEYGVREEGFIDYTSGIDFSEERIKRLSQENIETILNKNGVPLNKKLIVSWGRISSYKRFDLVFSAGKKSGLYPIVVSNSQSEELKQFISINKIEGLFVENYCRFELINALMQWKHTEIVTFLADGEHGAISIVEAMFVTSNAEAAVCLVSNSGNFPELIKNRKEGFITNNKSMTDIANTIENIKMLSDSERNEIHRNAMRKVLADSSIKKNIIHMLGEAIPIMGYLADEFMEQIGLKEELNQYRK